MSDLIAFLKQNIFYSLNFTSNTNFKYIFKNKRIYVA